MLPALKPGKGILCFNWAYIFGKPKTGDIVVLQVGGKLMIKRIQKINATQIFVAGDNQKHSTDSRNFGWIKIRQITGKVVGI